MARILLVDSDAESRATLADRLRRQGYTVAEATDGADGAIAALGAPPDAVVADLWMPSISGVQLCRLLNAEPATMNVPIVLRGADDQRSRFWAERAGAIAYVVKGRMGDLVRALARSVGQRSDEDDFFTALPEESSDIRDRIAAHLDQALFDSVIAGEVRQLATCESFERLFDRFAQFVSEVTSYRWLALATSAPQRMGIHARQGRRARALEEVSACLGSAANVLHVEDDDAADTDMGPPPIVRTIDFGDMRLGQLAIAPCRDSADDQHLATMIARELGGALRTATLVEETRRLASVDALTGLRNRRAFVELANRELLSCARFGEPLTVLLLDIDHFKQINDTRGHAAGDLAIAAVGASVAGAVRGIDIPARWGGEEFVIALPRTPREGALSVAERVRAEIQSLHVLDPLGEPMPLTVSVGVATYDAPETLDELVDRADRAMYVAKTTGRNRVRASERVYEACAE
jgi:two-component system cell cycle response regulator